MVTDIKLLQLSIVSHNKYITVLPKRYAIMLLYLLPGIYNDENQMPEYKIISEIQLASIKGPKN